MTIIQTDADTNVDLVRYIRVMSRQYSLNISHCSVANRIEASIQYFILRENRCALDSSIINSVVLHMAFFEENPMKWYSIVSSNPNAGHFQQRVSQMRPEHIFRAWFAHPQSHTARLPTLTQPGFLFVTGVARLRRVHTAMF